jgi:hypothetical protein
MYISSICVIAPSHIQCHSLINFLVVIWLCENVCNLYKQEQWTDTKAMTCWNQLARDLTIRLNDNMHQGATIEEHEVKSKQSKLHYKENITMGQGN